jgi:hypothetical protein
MATYPDGFKVIRTSKDKVDKNATKVVDHTWTMDFTGCTLEQVAEKAADGIVITMQSRYRRNPKDYPGGGYTVSVIDLIAGRHAVRMTPERFKAELAAADEATRDAILAEARAILDALPDEKGSSKK